MRVTGRLPGPQKRRNDRRTAMTEKNLPPAAWPVKVIRSRRRRKTVEARLNAGTLEVLAPARMSDADLAPIIAKLTRRLARRTRRAPQSDDELQQRAQQLNHQYFGDRFRWQSIRYVGNQQRRYGSCTPSMGTIRISDRVAALPPWVRDYVIVHELCHLAEANHGPRFWQLVNRYPRAERARGYLMALDLEEGDGDDGS